jgi:DNA uptake protein ComE-like DNA-binding protein
VNASRLPCHRKDPTRLRAAAIAAVCLGLLAGVLTGSPPAAAQTPPAASQPGGPYTTGNRLDLNRASQEEILQLPIAPELARAIYDFRTFRSLFGSVYDLLAVPGMTSATFAEIRDLVTVAPRFVVVQDAQEDERMEAAYDEVQRLLAQEGVSEGLVDEYLDLLRQPRNVNNMDYFDLVTIQNVSPIDAVAILKARREKPFETTQELRRTDGLSYWGYRNLRDFVRFDDGAAKNRWKVAGDFQARVYDTPYTLDDSDILRDQLAGASDVVIKNSGDLYNDQVNSLWGRLGMDAAKPTLTNKLRLRMGNDIKIGVLTNRNLGEEHFDETLKWFAGVENQKLGPVTINGAYLGNFRVAFGHGLVMDNTDFFASRRTGMGYNIRPEGIRGDISRSDESALKGGAVEATLGPVRGTLFYSNDNKDAILNPDHSFNRMITMVPRVENDVLEDIQDFVTSPKTAFLPMRDVMKEKIWGGNLKYNFWPGTYVGLTALEMKYRNRAFSDSTGQLDRFNPLATTLIINPALIELRDSDVSSAYNNTKLGNFRDIVGAEAGAVYQNVSFQGEYAKLANSKKDSYLSRALANGPEAWIGSAYFQYENLNFLALYRDYDLGYDNPYNRAFSETNRYDGTLLGDEYRLWNPLFSYLGEGDPQSKAEKGWFFTTRYQINRAFTINYVEYDRYRRKTDNAQMQRLTASLEYRPIFPVRIRVRQRYSDRDGVAKEDVRDFRGWDTRFEFRFFLSQYDRLDFLYSTTNVLFGPRPRLSGSDDGVPASSYTDPSTTLGTRAIPGQAFQSKFTHNFNPGLSVTWSSEIYDQFLWNFEDNEFLAFDGTAYRNWFLVRSRISNALSWRLKYTVDSQLPVTYLDIRNYGNPTTSPVFSAESGANSNCKDATNSFRFQLDYTF